jgi:hypothetical protein
MDGMKIDIGKGRVIPGSGSAEFDVKYRAIVFRPFKVSNMTFSKPIQPGLTNFRVKWSMQLLQM